MKKNHFFKNILKNKDFSKNLKNCVTGWVLKIPYMNAASEKKDKISADTI